MIELIHVCEQCGFEFNGRDGRRFCSCRCFGLSNRDKVIQQNKDRRKYPEVEGLTRHQVWYRQDAAGRKKTLDKDREKRREVVRRLGGRCIQCGFSDIRALVLDHKTGDGGQDRKRVGNRIARYYVRHPDEAKEKLQVLCANCNMIKAVQNNEHNQSRRIKEDETLKKMNK